MPALYAFAEAIFRGVQITPSGAQAAPSYWIASTFGSLIGLTATFAVSVLGFGQATNEQIKKNG